MLLLAAMAVCSCKKEREKAVEKQKPTPAAKKAPPSPAPGTCDMADQKAVLGIYAKATGKTTQYMHGFASAAMPELAPIESHDISDSDPVLVGLVYQCTYYPDAATTAWAVLLDLGWAKADAAERAKLATRIDDLVFDTGFEKAPSGWDAKHTFAPPATTATADGGVKRVRWSAAGQTTILGYLPAFGRFEIVFAADGSTAGPKLLERFEGEQRSIEEQLLDVGDAQKKFDEAMGRSNEDLTAAAATCDPATKPTRAWAYQQYLKEGGEKHNHPYVHFRPHGRVADLWELTLEGGPDQPSEHRLTRVFRCKVFKDDRKLAQAILLDWGWKEADGAARAELAAKIDQRMNDVVTSQPTDWSPRHTFAAPEAKALPGGGVQLVRWVDEHHVVSYFSGESEAHYLRQKITYGPGALPSPPRTLEKFLHAARGHFHFP